MPPIFIIFIYELGNHTEKAQSKIAINIVIKYNLVLDPSHKHSKIWFNVIKFCLTS